jgi:hypothetical protein
MRSNLFWLAHDCPPAQRLIRCVKATAKSTFSAGTYAAKRFLDSFKLAQEPSLHPEFIRSTWREEIMR